MDSNGGDVSFNLCKATHFLKDHSLLPLMSVTDDSTWCSLSTGKRLVEWSNDN